MGGGVLSLHLSFPPFVLGPMFLPDVLGSNSTDSAFKGNTLKTTFVSTAKARALKDDSQMSRPANFAQSHV